MRGRVQNISSVSNCSVCRSIPVVCVGGEPPGLAALIGGLPALHLDCDLVNCCVAEYGDEERVDVAWCVEDCESVGYVVLEACSTKECSVEEC